MQPFRYVHAANLRLDTPLAGLTGSVPDSVNRCLAEAPCTVLTRLTDLCGRERPDFLLLTGHTFTPAAPLLGSRLRLVETCAALARTGVTVMVVPEIPEGVEAVAAQWAWLRDLGDLPSNIRFPDAETTPWTLENGITLQPDMFAPWNTPALGLGFHEPGPHGCVVVDVLSPDDAALQTDPCPVRQRFEPLSPVEWRTVTLRLDAQPDPAESPESAVQRLAGRLARRLGAESVGLPAGCELVILRVILETETPLEPRLQQQVLDHLRETGALLWPAELETRTPAATGENLEIRRDLTGELIRLAHTLDTSLTDNAADTSPETALVSEALAPLYAQPPTRSGLAAPSAESLRELVRSAAALCLDQLDAAGGQAAREKL